MKKEFSAKFRSQCNICNSVYEFERMVFVLEEDSAEFILQFSEKYSELKEDFCKNCSSPTYSNIPFGYFSSKYGVTILTYYSYNDYPEFKNKITKSFDLFERFVDSDTASVIKNHPYVLVNGWSGLNNFSKLLIGNEIDLSTTKEHEYFLICNGFIYDRLFFYYVEDLKINPLLQAILGISSHYRNIGELNFAYKILKSVVVCGINNSSVLKELGIILLNLNDKENAKPILQKAKENQHKWLGITLDFLDATPRRRADAESQKEDLPHCLPILSLQKFTDVPHTLIRNCPGAKDIGISYFPDMEEIESDNKLNQSEYLQILSIVLGEFWNAKKQAQNGLYTNFYLHLTNLHEALSIELSGNISNEDFQLFWHNFASYIVKIDELIEANESAESISNKLGRFMGFLNWERTNSNSQISDFENYLLKNLERAIMNLFNNFLTYQESDKSYEKIMLQGFYDEIADNGGPKIEISYE